jgi:hypothetical protein
MTPEQHQQLQAHVTAIAQLLHADATEAGMSLKSLGEIEETVRTQVQTHVSPKLGIFLSTPAQTPIRDRPEN